MTFDTDKITRLKSSEEDNGDMVDDSFAWKNLTTLEQGLKNCWQQHYSKDVFNVAKVDFQKIATSGDKNELHKLAIIVVLTLIMHSHSEAAFQIFQDQLNIQDAEVASYGQLMTESLLQTMTDFTGHVVENEEEYPTGFNGTPSKRNAPESPLRRRKTSEFNKEMLEKFDRSEKELLDLKQVSKQ